MKITKSQLRKLIREAIRGRPPARGSHYRQNKRAAISASTAETTRESQPEDAAITYTGPDPMGEILRWAEGGGNIINNKTGAGVYPGYSDPDNPGKNIVDGKPYPTSKASADWAKKGGKFTAKMAKYKPGNLFALQVWSDTMKDWETRKIVKL